MDWAQGLISPSPYTYLDKFDISYNMHKKVINTLAKNQLTSNNSNRKYYQYYDAQLISIKVTIEY